MAGIKKIIFRGHAILASLYVIAQVTFAWDADKSSYDAGIVPSPQTYSYTYDGNGRIEGPTNIVRKYVTDHLGNVRASVTG